MRDAGNQSRGYGNHHVVSVLNYRLREPAACLTGISGYVPESQRLFSGNEPFGVDVCECNDRGLTTSEATVVPRLPRGRRMVRLNQPVRARICPQRLDLQNFRPHCREIDGEPLRVCASTENIADVRIISRCGRSEGTRSTTLRTTKRTPVDCDSRCRRRRP